MTRPERLMWALGEVIAVPLIAAVELVGWAADRVATRWANETGDDE